MKINDYKSNSVNPYFGIKVSQEFINFSHSYINNKTAGSRLQNIHMFNEKVKKFELFGKDNYTLKYEKILDKKTNNWQHYLVAIKDTGKGNPRVNIIPNRNTFLKVINKFLNMDIREFQSRFGRE